MANYDRLAQIFARRAGTARKGEMMVTSHEVWSYGELIAKSSGPDSVEVNTKRYSKTTSSHRNAVIRELEAEGYVLEEDSDQDGWVTYTK